MMTKFTEAQIKAIGGLSPRDRSIPHIEELVECAIAAAPRMLEGSIKKWWASAQIAARSMREANSETALGFLLRKGISAAANNWYTLSERRWQEYAAQESSDGVASWYGPLYHTSIPGEVKRGGRFPEVGIQGEDSVLRNRKFGQMVAIERELFDDDQTGQIRQYAQKLGDSMGVTESVFAAFRFLGTARSYAGLDVPASGYTTTDVNGATVSGPWSATLYGSSAGNRAQTYKALNVGALSDGYTALLNAKDPLQNIIMVRPNTLLVSSMDALHGETLLKPGPWPGVIGQSNIAAANNPVLGGTSATGGTSQGVLAGFPGGWNSPNPFGAMGIKLVVERYLPSWACAFGEAGKGFVFQVRDPLEISEEGKGAGSYFDFDVIRYRSRERFEVDWIGGGSRFWYLINDGSVSGQH